MIRVGLGNCAHKDIANGVWSLAPFWQGSPTCQRAYHVLRVKLFVHIYCSYICLRNRPNNFLQIHVNSDGILIGVSVYFADIGTNACIIQALADLLID